MTRTLPEFVRALPKAELHLHVEGTLEPEIMFDAGPRNGVRLPFAFRGGGARRPIDFARPADFLDLYYQGRRAAPEEDFHELALAYLERAAADGVRHAEVFFDPQAHTERGVASARSVRASSPASGAERAHGITSRLILCFLRHLPEADAMEPSRRRAPIWNKLLRRRPRFLRARATRRRSSPQYSPGPRERGLRAVAHAGEEGPPEYVREALDLLKVERIDHGDRCARGPGAGGAAARGADRR